MATNKMVETDENVHDFVARVENEVRRNDALKLIDIFRDVSGFEPKMWGASIIGFGSYHYKYDSGREGDAPLVGFSPRKDAMVLYLIGNYDKKDELLDDLGKHKTSKACIYVKKLDDINIDVLKKLIQNCIIDMKEKYN